MVAVISNGTAILGLGNLGALASKPVMEGKSVLFKRFADIDSIDLEIATEDADEFINAVKYLAGFGGINLEDIKAPECFIIEQRLRELMTIPVFHDDQHGTAIICAAGLINALDLTDRDMKHCRVVINGAGAAGIAWQFSSLFGRDSGVALLVFFMALKPMEMRSRRDAMVVVMLGFFLLLTHYFYSQSILTRLWLLATSTLLTATLIRLHGGPQPLRSIARYAALMLAQALPFMLAMFVLFPSVNGPLWGLPQDAYSGLAGLSDRMSPGSLDNLIQSGAIAFRVQFADDIPEKSSLYWRGPVFIDYDGQTWRSRPAYMQRTTSPPLIEADGAGTRYVITLEPHNLRWLLPLDLPTALPDGAIITSTLETFAREPVRNRARYAFTSALTFRVNRQETTNVRQQAPRLPRGLNPRARELAESWQARFKSAEMISTPRSSTFARKTSSTRCNRSCSANTPSTISCSPRTAASASTTRRPTSFSCAPPASRHASSPVIRAVKSIRSTAI